MFSLHQQHRSLEQHIISGIEANKTETNTEQHPVTAANLCDQAENMWSRDTCQMLHVVTWHDQPAGTNNLLLVPLVYEDEDNAYDDENSYDSKDNANDHIRILATCSCRCDDSELYTLLAKRWRKHTECYIVHGICHYAI